MKALVPVFALMLSGAAAAQQRVTGTYSSLRMGTEDLSGAEVTVVYGGNGYYAIVQCAEGSPGIPLVVPAKVIGEVLTFTVTEASSGCPPAMFSGTISHKGLSGAFEGSSWPGLLKRGKSYWQ